MIRQECRVGMVVVFGRDRGEKTVGKVVKCNPTKAKVKTLESRGADWKRRGNAAGQEWGVPYSMMRLATADEISNLSEDVAKQLPLSAYRIPAKMEYNEFDSKNAILELILGVYCGLSPENLFCDGEISATQARIKEADLRMQLKGLEIAYGRSVSEGEIYQWDESRRNKKIPA